MPGLGISLVPVLVLIATLYYTIVVLDGSGHIPLIIGAMVASAIAGSALGMSWDEIQKGLTAGIVTALPAILILIVVGLLIGVWIASGVVPVMIFYGLKILAPGYFLVATCVICAVISLATGSSWSTAATVRPPTRGAGRWRLGGGRMGRPRRGGCGGWGWRFEGGQRVKRGRLVASLTAATF